jgi:hypothetical protein
MRETPARASGFGAARLSRGTALTKFGQRREERHMDGPVLWVVVGVVGVLLLIFLFRMGRGGRGAVGASGGRRGFRGRFRR